MGNGGGKQNLEAISNEQSVLSDCPVLVDLGHGTVRHRHQDENSSSKGKTGYFYHARLNDFSLDAELANCDVHKLRYVFRGPSKNDGKRLYYIYGNTMDASDAGIQKQMYRPQGKGYSWPQSYRKRNHLYYRLIVNSNDATEANGAAEESESDGLSTVPGGELGTQQREHMFMKRSTMATVADLKQDLSIRLLRPSAHIHLIYNENETRNHETMFQLMNCSTLRRSDFLAIELHLDS